MKIIYDYKNGVYNIVVEYPESDLHIVTDNIFEARGYFIKHMTEIFDDTVSAQFKTE